MSFPTTGILDAFGRTENPLSDGGAWTTPAFGAADNAPQCDAGIAWNSGGGGSTSASRGGALANSEAYHTIQDKRTWVIFVRGSGAAGSLNGYYARFISADTCQLIRIDAGVPTQLGATVSGVVQAADDQLGIDVVGSDIGGYQNGVQLLTRNDTTYATGFVGFQNNSFNSPTGFKNFGGGSIASAPTPPSPIFVVQGTRW